MRLRILTLALAAAGVLAGSGGAGAQRPIGTADSLYRAAQQLLAANDYSRSATLFRDVAMRYPESTHADEALYWRAWALYHSGSDHNSRSDLDAAAAALDLQWQNYPRSITQDARDLRIRIRTAQAKLGDAKAAASVSSTAQQLDQSTGCPSEDDDMRIVALQGLMSMDAESAVPILKQVLARRGACTEALRKTAVFILSQKRGGGAEVTSMLLDVARHDPSSDVRGDAIQWLGQTQSDAAIVALDSVLFSSADDELRNKALFALSQSRSSQATQALKRAAADNHLSEELRGQAVFWLGQTHRTDLDFFRTLFKQSPSDEIRGKIVMAVAQQRTPEGAKWLLDLARDKSIDIESRKNAVFWAAQEGASIALLSSLYDDTRGEHDLQNHILFTLSQRSDPAALDKLFSVAKNDSDTELKKQAIFWISQKKNDPRAVAFMLELIKG